MSDVIKVLVFGTMPPCSCGRCLEAEKQARLAAKRFPRGQVVVEKHDAFSKAGRENQISVTPTVIIGGRKAAVGKVLSEEQIFEILITLVKRDGPRTAIQCSKIPYQKAILEPA